jgi:hypothetical protein
MDSLEHLARLASIRDGGSSKPPRTVADILDEATVSIARCLGRPADRHLPSLIWYRDPAVEMQERRHYGGARSVGAAPERGWGVAG